MYKLLDSNPQLTEILGYYKNQRVIFRDSKLDNQTLVSVESVFEQAEEKSPFGLGIETRLVGDNLRRSLNPAPFNFLRALHLDKVHFVLDLSEDFGEVAHYLADQVGHVESVKVDQDLARLSVRRCANKPNVRVILEDLQQLAWPRQHYDLSYLAS